MNITNTDRHKIVLGILAASLLAIGFLSVDIRAKDRETRTLNREIRSIKDETAKINAELPSLRQASKTAIEQADQIYIATEDPQTWCSELLNDPFMESSFKMSFRVRGKDIPYGMDTPLGLRQLENYVYPTLASCTVKVDLTGTLEQISFFLKELDRKKPAMLVEELDIEHTETQGIFTGTATLMVPQLLYTEDLDRIEQLAKGL